MSTQSEFNSEDYPEDALDPTYLLNTLLEGETMEREKDDSEFAYLRRELRHSTVAVSSDLNLFVDSAPEYKHTEKRNPDNEFAEQFIGEDNVIEIQHLEIQERLPMNFYPSNNGMKPVSIDADEVWELHLEVTRRLRNKIEMIIFQRTLKEIVFKKNILQEQRFIFRIIWQ